MRSARVVVLEPVWQGGVAGVVGGVGLAVCPFATHGLVEALDLAVGLRSVRPDLEVADVLVGEQSREAVVVRVGPGVVRG